MNRASPSAVAVPMAYAEIPQCPCGRARAGCDYHDPMRLAVTVRAGCFLDAKEGQRLLFPGHKFATVLGVASDGSLRVVFDDALTSRG